MPATQSDDVDFTALVERILRGHGFDDDALDRLRDHYFGDTTRQFVLTGVPSEPGPTAREVARDRFRVASEVIERFMPLGMLTAFMHAYSRRDFFSDVLFVDLLRHVDLALGEAFVSGETPMVTSEIVRAAVEIGTAFPPIPLAFAAYQAAICAYLVRLRDAIEQHPGLSDRQRQRGRDVVYSLLDIGFGISNDGFLAHLFPMVAFAYRQNHRDDVSARPTLLDFQEGIQAAERGGLFLADFPDVQGRTVHVICPARDVILRSSTVDVDAVSVPERNVAAAFLGMSIFHFSRRIEAALDAELPSALHAASAFTERLKTASVPLFFERLRALSGPDAHPERLRGVRAFVRSQPDPRQVAESVTLSPLLPRSVRAQLLIDLARLDSLSRGDREQMLLAAARFHEPALRAIVTKAVFSSPFLSRNERLALAAFEHHARHAAKRRESARRPRAANAVRHANRFRASAT